MQIHIPHLTNVTNLVFGGPQLNELFVTTTAAKGLVPSDQAGYLYRIRFNDPQIRGRELYKART